MAFGNLLRKSHSHVTRFFNSTLPSSARQTVRFFNNSVVPLARNVHKVSQAIGQEVAQNPQASQKLKDKASKVSNFADLGMSRLNEIQQSTNRVADKLGLS